MNKTFKFLAGIVLAGMVAGQSADWLANFNGKCILCVQADGVYCQSKGNCVP